MKFIIPDLELIVENKTSNAPTQIDELEAIASSVDTNLNKDVKISPDILNSFKLREDLNPDIWPNGKLDPIIQKKLLKIANGFLRDLNLGKGYKIKDIIFTGSLANYNWSKYSDIDLHVVLDFKQFDGTPEMIKDYFKSQKSLWNNEHSIQVKGYPVEIYAQDSNERLDATAIYSVLKNKWILKPNKESFSLDKKTIKSRAKNFIEQLKHIRDEYNDKHYESVVDLSTKLKDKVKQMRKAGLERGGEFSTENLVFKVLRRTPFMDILSSYKIKAYDNLMSVNELKQLDEGPILDNTKFKFENHEDNITINAFYETHKIASVTLTQITAGGFYLFDGSISEEEYHKLFPNDEFAYINNLRVYQNNFKGEGVGKKLMLLAMAKAKSLGFTIIALNASPSGLSLDDLIGFYENLGFKVFKHDGPNALMIYRFNSEKTLKENNSNNVGGVIFIKGEKLENGEQRLFATTIKDLLTLPRKRTDNSEGLEAKMAVFGSNRVFRVALDDNKQLKAMTVGWPNEKVMLSKLALTKTSVALNNAKTPLHWVSTDFNNVAQAVLQMSSELQNIPNIRWIG